MGQVLLSEVDPLRRPLRYGNHIGLDVVTLPNAQWDLTKVFVGKVDWFLRPLWPWVQWQ